ncbi:hypothetical protein J2Y48_004716 [Mycoplana sp. BE70]|uniref:hypothetical protein n=1 Tax=Mycoplana sp. BE70 TaxID=2817775 RepID=UPI00286272B6|nr:hypothetical protein [Mycoplana sp. BE70]MDR6759400.1 hypothetical protein [Mycoplana sp. BE70]
MKGSQAMQGWQSVVDSRVYCICEEYGVTIVDGRSYPGIRETRAVVTLDRILAAKGEDHFRLVLSTVAETENNQGYIDNHLLLAVSDLVETYRAIVEPRSLWMARMLRQGSYGRMSPAPTVRPDGHVGRESSA